jgi:putative flippase GtrA
MLLFSKWKTEFPYVSRYAGSGVINTFLGFSCIFSAMQLGFSPFSANLIGYAVGFLLGFFLSKKFVFRNEGKFARQGLIYLLSFIFSFCCNLLVLKLAILLSIHAIVSQFCSAVTFTVIMYILSRIFIFDSKFSR